MTFTEYLRSRLVDMLNNKRIVVWYDPVGHFAEFYSSFEAPSCVKLSVAESLLRARRRADEVYRGMNESEDPATARRNLLIYVSYARGIDEDSKMSDPFEVFALAGTAFGDTEDQLMESLARQAAPERADEIARLFREGKPTVALLDSLEEAHLYPLLNRIVGTESSVETIALALCDEAKSAAIETTPGCLQELLRLLKAAIGFEPENPNSWKDVREELGRFVLFSEFVFDLPEGLPDSFGIMKRAEEAAKETIYSACDRMRSDANLKEGYVVLAERIENTIRLPEMTADIVDLGDRDTFPFEERRRFGRLVEYLMQGNIDDARKLFEKTKRSMWRESPERGVLWTAAERAVNLLETASRIESEKPWKLDRLTRLVDAYADGKLSDLDRNQRLFEQSVVMCVADVELSPLVDPCRRRYCEIAVRMQKALLKLVQTENWPPEGVLRQTRIFDEYVSPNLERREKTAYVMVDSLRYEMGRDLGETLRRFGDVEIRHAAAVVPTITETGMAALLPKADGAFRLTEKDGVAAPALNETVLKNSADRMKLLKASFGDRFMDVTLDELLTNFKKHASQIASKDLLVVRTSDPDTIGEYGSRLARKYISDVIGDITVLIGRLVTAGFSRVVIIADHGHILLPEIAAGDVVSKPQGTWVLEKRRCLVGKKLSGGEGCSCFKAEHVGLKYDDGDVCIPSGFKVFAAGDSYLHSGLSLQEAVIPVVIVRTRRETETGGGRRQIAVQYRSDKFTARVIGLAVSVSAQADLFGTPVKVRVEAYDGAGPKAKRVGEAADCEARDENTHDILLTPGKETQVPVLLDPDFQSPSVEIRVIDPVTRIVWAKLTLKNAMLE